MLGREQQQAVSFTALDQRRRNCAVHNASIMFVARSCHSELLIADDDDWIRWTQAHTSQSSTASCYVIPALIEEYAGLEVNALTYWKPVKIIAHAVQDAVELPSSSDESCHRIQDRLQWMQVACTHTA